MSIIDKICKQTAVYWNPQGLDAYGQPMYSIPVEVSCRWEDKSEEYIAEDGTRQVSKSIIYILADISIGALLMLGDLDNVTDYVNPKNNSGVIEARGFDKIPNFRATQYLRKVYA